MNKKQKVKDHSLSFHPKINTVTIWVSVIPEFFFMST